jgi:hypothetical protein
MKALILHGSKDVRTDNVPRALFRQLSSASTSQVCHRPRHASWLPPEGGKHHWYPEAAPVLLLSFVG